MNTLILGCGPAGLIAAHAATVAGSDIRILSKFQKSPLYGAQYLHEPIPLTPAAYLVGEQVAYTLEGDALSYRLKVYGDTWDGNVSPEDLDEDHLAWDLRGTYDWLWDYYKHTIIDFEVSPILMPSLSSIAETADLVVNAMPRPLLCAGGHTFASQDIWAAGDAPELGIKVPHTCPPMTVVCNGGEQSWYRKSNIFNRTTVEWSLNTIGDQKPLPTASLVRKPLWHNCDCKHWDTPTIHVGRYGSWHKGVLSHESYRQVLDRIGAGF